MDKTAKSKLKEKKMEDNEEGITIEMSYNISDIWIVMAVGDDGMYQVHRRVGDKGILMGVLYDKPSALVIFNREVAKVTREWELAE